MIAFALPLALWALVAKAAPADDIAATVNNGLATFKACYDSSARAGASGKVITRFTVGTDGKVSNALIVSSELKNEKLESCVLEALKALTFNAPASGSVQVEYPFVFQPSAKGKKKK